MAERRSQSIVMRGPSIKVGRVTIGDMETRMSAPPVDLTPKVKAEITALTVQMHKDFMEKALLIVAGSPAPEGQAIRGNVQDEPDLSDGV